MRCRSCVDCCLHKSASKESLVNCVESGVNNVDSLDQETESSGGSDCSCRNCSSDCEYTVCLENNASMDYLDEPESDNEVMSDHEFYSEFDWRCIDDDSVEIEIDSPQSSPSSHDEEMRNTLELLDSVRSDFSDDDTPQATIGVDVDSSFSGDNMSTSSEEDEFYYVFEGDQDEEEEEEEHVDVVEDDNYDDAELSDDDLMSDDMDSIYVDNTSRATSQSDVSSGSRSRSPVPARISDRGSNSEASEAAEPVPPNRLAPASVVPAPSSNNHNGKLPAQNVTPSHQPKPKSSPSEPSPSEAPNEEEDARTCCICLDNLANHVVVPCGHICLCEACKELLVTNDNHGKKKKCPLCKTRFTIIIKVYK